MTAGEEKFSDDESRWNGIVHRDQAAEGEFYYAVKTTGVYCRPSCPSRHPKRDNVEFFDTFREAEKAGYRPCKRCRPDENSSQARLTDIIVQACRRLEEAETPIPLEQLAREAGLSRWHFHRLFKEFVGVTPKQYASARQAERFREGLETSRSVTEAIYEAGFSSSSRAYEKAGGRLAMTPSDYRKGAAGIAIRYGLAECFLGWVIVAATDKGICAILFGDDPQDLPPLVQKRFPKAELKEAGPYFSELVQQTVAFIEAPEKEFTLPLDIRGTAFQESVWNALRDIRPGATASYSEIAERLGRPKAARAVARACAANKLAVAVPCHRVMRNDGSLGGYRWGLERKQKLLQRESGQGEDREKS